MITLKKSALTLGPTRVINSHFHRPKNALSSGMWKGVNDAGKIGIFPVAETTPYIEIKMSSPLLRDKSGKLVRRGEWDEPEVPEYDLSMENTICYIQLPRKRITFIQCCTNVEDGGPTLYTCYTNVLCLLVMLCYSWLNYFTICQI